MIRKSTLFRAAFVYFTCLKWAQECAVNLSSEGLLRKKHWSSFRQDGPSCRAYDRPRRRCQKKPTVFAALHSYVQYSVSAVSRLCQSTKKIPSPLIPNNLLHSHVETMNIHVQNFYNFISFTYFCSKIVLK